MIQVLDDFLPSSEIESIYYAHHNQMNFNLNIATINRKADDIFIDELTRDSFQFCSTHYDSKDGTSSRYLPDLLKILEYAKVKYESIHRIKSNITTKLIGYKDNFHQPAHTDYGTDNYFSFIYYVNNSDGNTYFFNKDNEIIESVEPREGRAVMFDSNISHAGSNPIHSSLRMVVNYVLEKKLQ